MNLDDRDAVLAAVLAGELTMEEPRVRKLLAADPRLLAELEQAMAMQAAVREAAQAQREALAARDAVDPLLRERVAAAVGTAAAERAAVLAGRRRRWSVAAAAAIALLALAFWRLAAGTAPDPWLHANKHINGPKGQVEHYSPFSWTTGAPGEQFEVAVFAAEHAQKGRWLYNSDRGIHSPWTMPPEIEAALPAAICWELHVFGVEDPVPDIETAFASRR